MPNVANYVPSYTGSHALVIGINKYKRISPLAYAANDASAIAEVLVKKFGFPDRNVTLLQDAKATKNAIMQAYLRFAGDGTVNENDRILIFFAGHGHTVSGRRETGFLVPVDADLDDLSTLIRWDELTRDAELIPAKHMLFLMDACYGGLAVTRKPIPPGSSRFLEDMLARFTRQVITAGKGDETVSDGNGTRPNHSIFTAHLLDALDGAASPMPGITTAMGVMAYVYEMVGKDTHSQQTPHYGFIDGDGDFIFEMPDTVGAAAPDGKANKNTLIKLPALALPNESGALTIGAQVKAFLPNPVDRIRLDDLVTDCLKRTVETLSSSNFPAQASPGKSANQEFVDRIKQYEDAVTDIGAVATQLSRWAQPDQLPQIERIFTTLGETDMPRSGLSALIRLAWYPTTTVMYSAGIAALAAGRYDALHRCLFAPVSNVQTGNSDLKPVMDHVVYAMTDLFELFKLLPGADRKYAPRSEHMLTALQPVVEDQLYLGRRYEEYFDRFEIMLALSFGAAHTGLMSPFWGPPGRFAWKERSPFSDQKPFSTFVADAKRQGSEWPALKAGFFDGSAERFAEVADGYALLLGRINWI